MYINELEDEVKESIIDKNRSINVEGIDWWEDTIDHIKEAGKVIGIDIDNVYFSGFSSQGDGACFVGEYAYGVGSKELTKKRYPEDEELQKIAKNLQELQHDFFYQLSARVRHRGHYYHENCTTIDVDAPRDYFSARDGISEFLRDFMCWSYRLLESEYEDLVSDNHVEATLTINEYQFNSDGEEM